MTKGAEDRIDDIGVRADKARKERECQTITAMVLVLVVFFLFGVAIVLVFGDL